MSAIPKHIAIIMDGNGRWAKERGFSRESGHQRGARTIEEIVEVAKNIGIRYLTLYAFSEENWQRPKEEVRALMELLRLYLSSKREKMIKEGICFRAIGDLHSLSSELQKEIEETSAATKMGKNMTLIVALSYGSRQEICRAINKLLAKNITEVSPQLLTEALDTSGIPDPDLLIRTSGEYRISNFLLWQTAYTEFYFTDVHWPDFDQEELLKAIEEYQKRERRFGLISEQLMS
ncbi:MAG: polyprenyl diphosphate synthase [Pseudomonadota bacterium]